MADFLIQTIDNQVRHDFSFALMEAIDYQNWLHAGSHDYVLVDIREMFDHDYSGFIPSGTIKFMKKFILTYYDIHTISPINIPTDLFWSDFLKREVTLKTQGEHAFKEQKFIKSDTTIKGYSGVETFIKIPDGERYIVSDMIEIESEWRSFIYNKQLVGLQNYLGDFTIMPDISLIEQMVNEYKSSPQAYTLDVGINSKDGTFLIEVHNMYSTGTYGFSDNRILPQMIASGFRHLVKNRF